MNPTIPVDPLAEASSGADIAPRPSVSPPLYAATLYASAVGFMAGMIWAPWAKDHALSLLAHPTSWVSSLSLLPFLLGVVLVPPVVAAFARWSTGSGKGQG